MLKYREGRTSETVGTPTLHQYLLYLIIHTVTCYPILPRIRVLILNFKNVTVNSFKMPMSATKNVVQFLVSVYNTQLNLITLFHSKNAYYIRKITVVLPDESLSSITDLQG